MELIADKLFTGWKHITNLDCHYNGRIWVTWRPDYYQIVLKYKSAQLITCEVLNIPLQLSFEITFVYVLNTKEERRILWEDLVIHSRTCRKPWLVLGDFNSILSAEDRIGGNKVTWADVVDFNNCVMECDLLELPAQGNRYTWSDKHYKQRFFSKIDWIFIKEEWFHTLPDCAARFLPEEINDHCPTKVFLTTEK
ncbi:uncharacterized protein [Nicotiana tomentosiformis]|uniref:uncharacterized protein n=1 Tax=Nicotiana tomentosiformis TaxID=4098 RepID=UPI00388C86C8